MQKKVEAARTSKKNVDLDALLSGQEQTDDNEVDSEKDDTGDKNPRILHAAEKSQGILPQAQALPPVQLI